jgi:hypothetical protein
MVCNVEKSVGALNGALIQNDACWIKADGATGHRVGSFARPGT